MFALYLKIYSSDIEKAQRKEQLVKPTVIMTRFKFSWPILAIHYVISYSIQTKRSLLIKQNSIKVFGTS